MQLTHSSTKFPTKSRLGLQAAFGFLNLLFSFSRGPFHAIATRTNPTRILAFKRGF
jgi:hypothetical protein